jgi:hypothetical protein
MPKIKIKKKGAFRKNRNSEHDSGVPHCLGFAVFARNESQDV